MYIFNEQHDADFKKWAKNRDDIEYTSEKTAFKVGDVVIFENDFGVKFYGHKILAFDKKPINGRLIYLDKDSYWFAVMPESLTLYPGKSEACSNVLQLMDQDLSYSEALKTTLQLFKVKKYNLENELNIYI